MKKRILALGLSLVVGAAGVAAAATQTIGFKDTQLGTIQVGSFDWNVGNALSVGSAPLSTDPLNPTPFTLYFQAALSVFNDANGNTITGTGVASDYEITVIAGFGETGFRVDAGNTSLAAFEFDPNSSVNFFRMYYDTNVNSNALAGTGYDDGTLLLEGLVLPADPADGTPTAGGFTVTNVNLLNPLDGFGDDDYPNVVSLVGNGSNAAFVEVDPASVNGTYFAPGAPWILFFELLFNSSTIVPFSQTNPSAQFADGSGGNITPNFYQDPVTGLYINGFGVPGEGGPFDFQFQADANSSVRFAAVPEPGTMLLLGTGLLGLAGVGRARSKKS